MNRPMHPANPVRREYPTSTADAFAAGLDVYVDPDMEAELDNWAEAGMDLRAEYR